MLITESYIKKIIAEEYEKLLQEETLDESLRQWIASLALAATLAAPNIASASGRGPETNLKELDSDTKAAVVALVNHEVAKIELAHPNATLQQKAKAAETALELTNAVLQGRSDKKTVRDATATALASRKKDPTLFDKLVSTGKKIIAGTTIQGKQ